MISMDFPHTHTHTHTFNGPLYGTTRVSRYQKGKTNLDFTEARDSEWQWHQLGHMQVCISLLTSVLNKLQTCQHPTAQFFTGRMPFLPPNHQCQSTEGKVKVTEHCVLLGPQNSTKNFRNFHDTQAPPCCRIYLRVAILNSVQITEQLLLSPTQARSFCGSYWRGSE